MKEIRTKILLILDQFKQEELGNRLSQFAMLLLRSMIESELNKLEEKSDALPKKQNLPKVE